MIRSIQDMTEAAGRLIGLVAVAALAAGCASTPNADVQRATTAYEQIAKDTDVGRYASVPLYEAKKDLDRAIALEADGESEEASHVAGLAETRMNIARTEATAGKARDETQALYAEREKVQLEAATARARQAEQTLAELQAQPTDRGMVVSLGGDVLFNTGQSTLSPGAQSQLSRVKQFLENSPEREVVVEGHTDSAGGEDYNLALSQRRADAVANYLVQGSISPSRVATRGMGESLPKVSNETAAGRQQNRRVDLVILNPGQKAVERTLPRP